MIRTSSTTESEANHQPEFCIWDYDKTLSDGNSFVRDQLIEACHDAGYQTPGEILEGFKPVSQAFTWEVFFELNNIEFADQEVIKAAIVESWDERTTLNRRPPAELADGALEAVTRFASLKIKQVIATASPYISSELKAYLEETGLFEEGKIARLYSSAEHPDSSGSYFYRKTGLFKKILLEHGVPEDKALAVGDRVGDMSSARDLNIGLRIGVYTGDVEAEELKLCIETEFSALEGEW